MQTSEQEQARLSGTFNRIGGRIGRWVNGALVCAILYPMTESPAVMWAAIACVAAIGVEHAFGIRNLGQQITLGQRIEANVKAAYWNCQRALAKCLQGITPK